MTRKGFLVTRSRPLDTRERFSEIGGRFLGSRRASLVTRDRFLDTRKGFSGIGERPLVTKKAFLVPRDRPPIRARQGKVAIEKLLRAPGGFELLTRVQLEPSKVHMSP